MSGAASQAGQIKDTMPHQTLEFRGHLIDSLTLSKVADRIEQAGGFYELNDIRIGIHRQDISEINMTVFAQTDAQLQAIIEDLKPYGAVADSQSADIAPCPEDGQLPENAFTIRMPQRVRIQDRWLPLRSSQTFALVIRNQEAMLCPVADLRKGEQVVTGNHGIEWS
ncbi:MAG TPA: hypothetical protein V6C99_09735 [Oculatellaceae cyanobacterium]|jgi:hypothetical protein